MALPTSLLWRTNAVLGLSAVVIIATAFVAVQQLVIAPITEELADDEAGLVVLSAQTWVELPDYTDARPAFELEMARMHDVIISSDLRSLPPADTTDGYLALLQANMSERLGVPVRLLEGDDLLWAELPTPGASLQVGFVPGRQDIQPIYVGVAIGAIGAGIVFGAAFFMVRRIAGPLVETAQSVEAFRGAEGFSPLPERGPRELVALAANFNQMAREVSELLSNRTTLLAGISHDLRTPLARMRIAVELLPDTVDQKLAQRMERNLEAMDELIGDALRFARGAREAPQEVAAKPFIEDIVAEAAPDVAVEWRGPEAARARLAPGAFRRVLVNLLDNAKQHAADTAVVVTARDGLQVHVVDAGPGIPEADRERVFEPFYRLARSRGEGTGGSGLGLAIVRQLCQAHGWRVSIGASGCGGVDVCVSVAALIQSDTERVPAGNP